MPDLTDPLAALEMVHALLSKSTDAPTQGEETTSSTAQKTVGAHADTTLTPTDTPAPGSGGVSAPSVRAPTLTNTVQDDKNPSSVGASVQFGDKSLQLTRDPDPSGCPTHWHHVPELPPKGSRVRMVDRDGYGCLYRFKAGGRWWLAKFLPPFDGRLSLTDSEGRVRVLASLEEAAALLEVLSQKSTDAPTLTAENPPLTAQTSVSVHTDTTLTLEEGDVLVI